MKELLFLLLKLRAFLLFVFLEIVCLFLVVRYNNSQRQIFISSSNAISGYFYEKNNDISSFFDLREENESIADRNARLLQQIYQGSAQSEYIEGELIDSQYIFRAARVINNSVSDSRNYITLDIGSRQGIAPRMGVITETGVVGIIQNVSNHYSKASSILHIDSKLSAKVKSSGVTGSLQWQPGDHRVAQLKEIPKHYDDLAIGDTIVTSGYSIVFPANHPIGTVSSIDVLSGQNFYTMEVNLFVDLGKLDLVYIVEHRLKEEILSLENE